jgi:hypothetical protein
MSAQNAIPVDAKQTLPEQTGPSLWDIVDEMVEQKLRALNILPPIDEVDED